MPSKPQRVTAVAGTTSAEVSWKAPTSAGGEPITGYRVTAFPGGATCTLTATTCRIDGLVPGETYSFGVVARNPIGFGRPSLSNRVTVFSATK